MPRRLILPGPPQQRYRMRPLEEEMGRLVALARRGRTGPAAAMDALWELILHETEGLSLAEVAERGFHVQDYAMRADQAARLRDAMVQGRRLPRRVVAGFWVLWAAGDRGGECVDGRTAERTSVAPIERSSAVTCRWRVPGM